MKVIWEKKVDRQLSKIPDYIQKKFMAWALAIEKEGIRVLRKSPGFHDEPLKGQRSGQRSIRLSKAYRAIYIETRDGRIELIEVIEVSKHEY
ncbi:MAG: type II toxin-antitoxin system mRNA interferase toxin, RelE/StbE family [Deltaproteobacteria bacterium]|nr:type II toxin-antitoxin system mRNA interferase toxin, RelE/StbE family [Deltaproteobacteria bacterium]